MKKRALTDRTLKSLRPAKAGTRYDVMDGIVPGLAVRVTETSHKSFVLLARFPGSKNPTRRALGDYGELTIEKARQKARDWLALIEVGKDPKAEEERKRASEQQRRANAFGAVAEDFITEKLGKKVNKNSDGIEFASYAERKGAEVERDIRREFLPAWGNRPISDISDIDVVSIIKAKKAGAPAQARNLLGIANRLFAWAKEQRLYGLAVNPCADLRPKKLIGEKRARSRILSDDELFVFWRGAKRLGYPYAAVYQVLILTALRLNEAADAAWPEFDLRDRVWVVPADRMKGKNGIAREHAIPLTDDLQKILDDLPRFTGGDYLFSTTSGAKPAWISNKVKKRLDDRMLRTLRALAKMRGDDPAKVTLPRWTNHDLRRTVRSQLSRLKIAEEVREAVLAHARPGIKGVYDLHTYADEKRDALELWAARLHRIVEPPKPIDESVVVAMRA